MMNSYSVSSSIVILSEAKRSRRISGSTAVRFSVKRSFDPVRLHFVAPNSAQDDIDIVKVYAPCGAYSSITFRAMTMRCTSLVPSPMVSSFESRQNFSTGYSLMYP
jgi:hypothetical protein